MFTLFHWHEERVFEEVVLLGGLVMDCQGRRRESMNEDATLIRKPMVSIATPREGVSLPPPYAAHTHARTRTHTHCLFGCRV